ncbi:MAG: Metallo-beta-lactamase family protein [Candidatus Jorgensenbacteria bacterium GW2011_GWA1_48_13]|uniref:Ribonuclease J n=2 Tax=Candidatus Joergenseniibacteriota TaxID=1752739 RepID=A0A0G1W974_9BACT|nr:MAG: Metallo-beta-lactamase family protein [Candidatus Jorgensenbacteria bacterium GW2011_GWA1_48_13]KKW15338.1 MAG: Metallo-beta-lactamase family protein [Candidatus Jorgensenbacteria bacterium GW2011_GWB1_50_10]
MTPKTALTQRRTFSRTRRPVSAEMKREGADSEPVVRWVALGGLEEIGRNMMFFEYRDEIIIIDAGLQFPEEETPGIDYIIPNVSYLEERKEKIKALIITHGHYDHIGAIPYLLGKLGNPIIYTTQISKEIILRRQEDFPHSPKPNFVMVKGGEIHKLSENFSATFFDVIHNIPEGVGMIIKTPIGNVVHPGEFKFDYDNEGHARGLDTWKWVSEQGIHTLMLDSTGAETPGYSLSERVVEKELEKIFKAAEGRIIVGTFSSLLDRLAEIIKIAEHLKRRVAISGFSMKTNIQIAQNLKYMKIQRGTLIPIEEVNRHPDDKVMILATGAQGEPNAALMRVANGEHRHVKVKNTDTIILSSSIVPGNERSVQNLKDNLARQGAKIFHYKMLDIHSSGHAPQEELRTVMRLVKPRFFLPIHGYYFMRSRNAQLAQEELGLETTNTLIADNGLVVEFRKDSVRVTDEKVPVFYVMVDGLGVGDVGEVVLRDRITLAQEGMIVIIATLSRQNGRVLKNPDIISRGFIYLKENQGMLDEIRRKIRGIIGRIPRHQPIDADYLKSLIRDQIGQFLYNKTKRRPMILPVVIEV